MRNSIYDSLIEGIRTREQPFFMYSIKSCFLALLCWVWAITFMGHTQVIIQLFYFNIGKSLAISRIEIQATMNFLSAVNICSWGRCLVFILRSPENYGKCWQSRTHTFKGLTFHHLGIIGAQVLPIFLDVPRKILAATEMWMSWLRQEKCVEECGPRAAAYQGDVRSCLVWLWLFSTVPYW
jgi:hypothetical protein